MPNTEAKKLRRHLAILFTGITIVLFFSGWKLQNKFDEQSKKLDKQAEQLARQSKKLDKQAKELAQQAKELDANCLDKKAARQWVTDELDMVNYVIITRRADDEELVEQARNLEERKLTEFEPVICD